MTIKLLRDSKSSFHITIGEEGIVIAHCNKGVSKARMFVRSTEENDVLKLKQLLTANPLAPMYIYLDTLDQSYIQRTIPTAGKIGIGTFARKRLERETPKSHLKACVQIDRLSTGRKDYVYTFMSAPFEAPLTRWLDFFLPYENIIKGIYLLPVEIYSVIQNLKAESKDQKKYSVKTIRESLFSFIRNFKSKKLKKNARWELFLSHHKTGGFRQVAYYDGKIIFSRMLNNINNPDADVVAGNIEQEIANSIEYLVRLSIGSEESVDMYLVLSQEIQKFIRVEKLKATNVYRFTPYELAQRLGLKEAAGEKDKFAEPVILACLSTNIVWKFTLHTPVTKKIYNFTTGIDFLRFALNTIIPATVFATIIILANVYLTKASISSFSKQISNLTAVITNNTKFIENAESSIGQDVKIEQLNEIVDLYMFLTSQEVNPLEFIIRLGQTLSEDFRVKIIKWSLQDDKLYNFKADKVNKVTLHDLMQPNKYSIEAEIELLINNYGKTVKGLQSNYKILSHALNSAFTDYTVQLAELPTELETQIEKNQPVSISSRFKKVFDPSVPLKPSLSNALEPGNAAAK